MTTCPGCGRDNVGTYIDVGALSPLLKACVRCHAKHGAEKLRLEADRLLEMFQAREAERLVPKHKRGRCWHCADPVLRDVLTGLYPMLCRGCTQEINAIKELNGQLPINDKDTEGALIV